MKRIVSLGLAAAFAVAMPAVQAQSIPTMEACAKYAEADAAYNTAEQEAKAARDAVYNAPYLAPTKEEREAARAASAARNAEASAAYEGAIEDARTVLTQTYVAIYAEGGGMQSDVGCHGEAAHPPKAALHGTLRAVTAAR